jgi:hypothetical protein
MLFLFGTSVYGNPFFPRLTSPALQPLWRRRTHIEMPIRPGLKGHGAVGVGIDTVQERKIMLRVHESFEEFLRDLHMLCVKYVRDSMIDTRFCTTGQGLCTLTQP